MTGPPVRTWRNCAIPNLTNHTDVFTAAEVCDHVIDIFPTRDDDERATEVQIAALEEFEALGALAKRFVAQRGLSVRRSWRVE